MAQSFSGEHSIFSYGHIDCIVTHGACIVTHGAKRWRFTGFYENPIAAQRSHSWKLLKRLAGIPELKALPWVVGGEFNEILFYFGKRGGIPRGASQLSVLSDILEDCGLRDLKCK